MSSFKLPNCSRACLSVVAALLIGTAAAALPAKLWCSHSGATKCSMETVQGAPSSPVFAAELQEAAAQAIAKYVAAKPGRASDHFHRWRFEALTGDFETNVDLQREVRRVVRHADFRQTFPQSPPLFFHSALGWEVRQRTAPNMQHHWEYEHHVDQFLATCAEIGVPLGLPVETNHGSFTVGELLDASRRSFDASQEIWWSLVAFCKYLPDEAQWENRFGETCSYEAMAEAILARPLDDGSCGGTHKQFAIASLLRDGSFHCITDDLRKRCEDYLTRSSRLLEHSQLPNGAWSPQWAKAGSVALGVGPTRGDDLVRITGHALEWIEVVPDSLRPSRDCVAHALRFLIEALGRSDSTSIQKDYCAYSHAACVLKRALERERTTALSVAAHDPTNQTRIVRRQTTSRPSELR